MAPELGKTPFRQVSMTPKEFDLLVETQRIAEERGLEEFDFKIDSEKEPLHFNTRYAKYLIEYIYQNFK